MAEEGKVQWFPGHMAKTRRLITEHLKLCDAAAELCDARIPQSSRNPELDRWLGGKPRILLLNKCDAADPVLTEEWVRYYGKQGLTVLPTDCRSGKGVRRFAPAVRERLSDLIAAREKRGMVGRPLRVMIVGIPNVGKSSLINRLCGARRTRAEDRPGVTRGLQWVTVERGLELLDMPGVLWPKFDDPAVGERLAFTGAVKDDVVDIEWLAIRLLSLLRECYPAALQSRYGIDPTEEPLSLLTALGKKRGMLLSGGEVNTERAAITLLDEFRAGKLGRITLERPE